MKEITFNKNNYKSYQDFYSDIYLKLDGKENHDFDFFLFLLGYSGDTLYEFLLYYYEDNIKYIFLNFNREKINLQKNFDDYKTNIIIKAFEDFVKRYPNNKIEFRMEK